MVAGRRRPRTRLSDNVVPGIEPGIKKAALLAPLFSFYDGEGRSVQHRPVGNLVLKGVAQLR